MDSASEPDVPASQDVGCATHANPACATSAQAGIVPSKYSMKSLGGHLRFKSAKMCGSACSAENSTKCPVQFCPVVKRGIACGLQHPTGWLSRILGWCSATASSHLARLTTANDGCLRSHFGQEPNAANTGTLCVIAAICGDLELK